MENKDTQKIRKEVFQKLGLNEVEKGIFSGSWIKGTSEKIIKSKSPTDGTDLSSINAASEDNYKSVVKTSRRAYEEWSEVPAPKRGEFIKKVSTALEDAKRDLGLIVSLEVGKVITEGQGEIQEMIDVGHYATGL